MADKDNSSQVSSEQPTEPDETGEGNTLAAKADEPIQQEKKRKASEDLSSVRKVAKLDEGSTAEASTEESISKENEEDVMCISDGSDKESEEGEVSDGDGGSNTIDLTSDSPPYQAHRSQHGLLQATNNGSQPCESDDDDCYIESIDLSAVREQEIQHDGYSSEDSYDSYDSSTVKDVQRRDNSAEQAEKRVKAFRHRAWIEHDKEATANPNEDTDFSFASYNILSQDLLDDNLYLYRHCNPDELDWDFRKLNILDEIGHHQPDVLCLQEVHEELYEVDMLANLENLGYLSVFKKKTGEETDDGCAILYKKDKFELINFFSVEYYNEDIPVLDRNNIGLIVMLKPTNNKVSDHKICIATTHLLFNPRRGDVKLAQLMVLLAEIDKHACKGTDKDGYPLYHPTILAGDFNAEPFSDIYKFIAKGELMYKGLPTSTLSGQKKSVCNNAYMPHKLVPNYIGITHQCQYAAEVRKRRQCETQQDSQQEPSLSVSDASSSDVSADKTDAQIEKSNAENTEAAASAETTETAASTETTETAASAESTETADSAEVNETDKSKSNGDTSKKSEEEASAKDAVDKQQEEISQDTAEQQTDGECSNKQQEKPVNKPPRRKAPTVSHAGTLEHRMRLKSVYNHQGEVTTNHLRANCTVDYIWYCTGRRPAADDQISGDKVMDLVKSLKLFSSSELNELGGLPNEVASSDHVILMATFRLSST